MFIVRITSGLGNQMYQYCFYLLLKKLYPEASVKADLTWFYANDDHFGYELSRIFGDSAGFVLEEAGYGEIFKATGVIPNMLRPKEMASPERGGFRRGTLGAKAAGIFEELRRYPNRILREFARKKRLPLLIDQIGGTWEGGLSLNNDDIYNVIRELDPSKDYYFTGFWIEERYYGRVLAEAKRAFVFPEISDEENLRLKCDIMSTESVGIHLRRGDYLTAYGDKFKSLSREYYGPAVDIICERTGLDRERLKFYIFSDDSKLAEAEFDFLKNKTVVSNNKGKESFRDMQLMSLCRHNIIANSTFSQWAALLNDNEGHLTVYPKQYMKGEDGEAKSLEGWIRCG